MADLQIMIDIETLASSQRPAILSVAAVVMNMDTLEIVDSKEWILDWEFQVNERGRQLNPETIKWWFSQDEAARRVIYELVPRINPENFTTEFYDYFASHGTKHVWANGVGFDLDILDEFFDSQAMQGLTYDGQTGKEIRPWKYHSIMCMRSIRQMFEHILPWDAFVEREIAENGHVKHSAMSDALVQARYILEVRKWLLSHQSSE